MGPAITSIAYTTLAVFTGVVVAFMIFDKEKRPLVIRIALLWLGATAVAFLLPNPLLGLALIGVLLVLLGPGAAVERICLYIASMAVLPDYYDAQIPFPGLNYLIALDYAKLATLILLGPVFVSSMFSKPPAHLRAVDRYLLFFVLLTGVMSIRDLPFTSMMRSTVDHILLVFVPYIAISRGLKTLDDVDLAVKSAFVSVVMLAVIGAISTVFSWNYYGQLAETISHKIYSDFRNGFLRVYATVNGMILGFLMGVGIACVLYVRAERRLPILYAGGLIALFAAVTFVTGARGGWMAAIVISGLFALFLKSGRFMRKAALAGMALSLAAGFMLVFKESDIISDQYGTFAYRAELLRTSIEQIAARPLFGQVDFRDSPRFAHLIQGEGIVDVVNGYLQVVLTYGLISFALFLAVQVLTLRGGLKTIALFDNVEHTEDTKRMRRLAILLTAVHIGFLALIMTVSAMSLSWNYCYMIVALSVAMTRLAAAAQAAPVAVPAPEPDGGADHRPNAPSRGHGSLRTPGRASAAGARPKPYGARFVR